MDGMTLEPLSAQVRFLSARARTGDDWSRILGDFLRKISARCETVEEAVIIGHIKGFASFPDGEYLRVSVVGSTLPVECEASASFESSEVSASINVIVYGLESARLEHIVRDEAASFSRASETTVTIETIATTHLQTNHEEGGGGHHGVDRGE